jgi:hypothetical protein
MGHSVQHSRLRLANHSICRKEALALWRESVSAKKLLSAMNFETSLAEQSPFTEPELIAAAPPSLSFR